MNLIHSRTRFLYNLMREKKERKEQMQNLNRCVTIGQDDRTNQCIKLLRLQFWGCVYENEMLRLDFYSH